MPDYTQLSDEELDKIFQSGGELPEEKKKRQEPRRDERGEWVMPAPTQTKLQSVGLDFSGEASTPLGMGRMETLMAGFGQPINQLIEGAKNKTALLFTRDPEAQKALYERISRERKERLGLDKPLLDSPWGSAGRTGFQVGTALAGPARLGPQAVLAGGLSALEDSASTTPTGFVSDLTDSAMRGGESALATYIAGKGIQGLGKAVGTSSGRFQHPEGEAAMAIDASARRLGMPPLSIGQLSPNSVAGQVEKNLSGYPGSVKAQGDALKRAADETVQVPKAVGRGTEAAVVPGGALKRDLQEAVKTLYNQARAKYTAVDDFALKEGLGNMQPSYTYNTLQTVAKRLTPPGKTAEHNPVFQALDYYDDKAFDWLKYGAQNVTPREVVKQGVPLSNYHDMRVAVNKALSATERQIKPGAPQELMETHKALKDLKTALDNDAARWAKAAEGNKEAMALYKEANDFWGQVVAPNALQNKLARKVMSRMRGYESSKDMFGDIMNNPELVARLRRTMPQRGRDITDVIENVPELGRYLRSGDLPEPAGRGALGALTAAATQHPIRAGAAAVTHAPGLNALARSDLAKRAYFSKDMFSGSAPAEAGFARLRPPQGWLPRAAWGAGQIPAEEIEAWEQKMLGQRKDRPKADRR